MKVLVVGHASMVGEAVCRSLNGRAEVITAGRTGADITFNATSEKIPDVNFDCDAAVLCAAGFGSDDEKGMLENVSVNVYGSLLSAVLAKRCGCRHIVYISSMFAIDHPDNQYFGSYGITKRQGGENVDFFCRRQNMGLATLLPSQLYDYQEKGRRHQGLFYRIIDRASKGEDVLLFGKMDPLRNFLHVDDLAEVIVRVLEGGITGFFNCLHPKSYTLGEIARIAFEAFGTSGNVRFIETENDLPSVYLPNDLRIYELAKYYPQTDLQTGITAIRETFL